MLGQHNDLHLAPLSLCAPLGVILLMSNKAPPLSTICLLLCDGGFFERKGGKALDADDFSIALFSDHRPQCLRLAGLCGQGRVLALEKLAGEGEIDAERPCPGHRRIADNRTQLNPLWKVIIDPLLGVGDHVQSAYAGTTYGLGCPAMHRNVVRMTGLTVRRECEDRVRDHLTNDVGNLLYCSASINGCAAAVGVAQPAMLRNAQEPQTLCQLSFPDGYELLRRPPRRIRHT